MNEKYCRVGKKTNGDPVTEITESNSHMIQN